MGIFSSIGSLFGPVGMVVGALADTSMAKKEQQKANAAEEAAYQRQLEAERLEAEKNRALAKSDAATKFTDMSAAAQKAGINPLTALRSTGGAGFGAYGGFASEAVAPVLSKFSFARTFSSNVAKAYYDQKVNQPIDKYNKQIRDLEIQQRVLDLKRTQGQIGQMAAGAMKNPLEAAMAKYKADPSGWTKMLDMRGNPIEVKNMILERLRLLPGQVYGLAEDMEALGGEIAGEFQGLGNIGDTFTKPVSRKVSTGQLSRTKITMDVLDRVFGQPTVGSVSRRATR